MSAIPESTNSITNLIDNYHAAKTEAPRAHLGASTLGHACERWLWLSFRWAVLEQHPGRIKRLFRRGQNEESTIVSDLKAIGVNVHSEQFRVSFGSHVSGSIDGIASGVPGAPKTEHVVEFKTHSKKSFDDLDKNAVKKSKPMHYTQMQVYMHGLKLDRALYVAVCKDDDRLYTERVHYDAEHAEKAINKGHRIALSDYIPAPISNDPTWYECKMCAGHDFCHGSKTTKQINCRTCAHITPLSDNTMHCAKWDAIVPTEAQVAGCDSHVMHPDMVPWKRLQSPNDMIAVYLINGAEYANGEPVEGVYSSKQLLELSK